jgi:Xaa-Pro aminopeptidase
MPHNHESAFYAKNRKQLLDLMPDNSTAIFLAARPKIRSGDSDYPYCQDENFYYLTGYEYPEATLILNKKNGNHQKEYLFIKEMSPTQVHWQGQRPSVESVKRTSGIEDCKSNEALDTALYRWLNSCSICYFDFTSFPPPHPIDPVQQYILSIKNRFPHLQIRRIRETVAVLRQKKQDWEIDRIKQAIKVTDSGIRSILSHAKAGQREYEIQAHFTYELNRVGCPLAFQPIIASGKNATILHYITNDSIMSKGQLVLLDLGAEFRHYSADISRTFPIDGKFTNQQRMFYNLVLEANRETIKAVKPGLTLQDVNNVTKKILTDGLKRMQFIKDDQEIDTYFTHNVSHMLGLTTHDVISDPLIPLEPGMVITIEPGLYIPELEMGIRIEDDVQVIANGAINLSEMIPKEVEELEHLLSDSSFR